MEIVTLHTKQETEVKWKSEVRRFPGVLSADMGIYYERVTLASWTSECFCVTIHLVLILLRIGTKGMNYRKVFQMQDPNLVIVVELIGAARCLMNTV